MSKDRNSDAENLVRRLTSSGLSLTTAESCTGGLLSAAITSVAGASAVFGYGFVTYSNEAKETLLGVSSDLLETYGAVSHEVAKAMAQGAAQKAKADIALSVTGIAGPSGATADKPVGLVYFGLSSRGEITSFRFVFSGTRDMIRQASREKALSLLLTIV